MRGRPARGGTSERGIHHGLDSHISRRTYASMRSKDQQRVPPWDFAGGKDKLDEVMASEKFDNLREVKVILRPERQVLPFEDSAKDIYWATTVLFSVWNKRGILVFE